MMAVMLWEGAFLPQSATTCREDLMVRESWKQREGKKCTVIILRFEGTAHITKWMYNDTNVNEVFSQSYGDG